MQNSFNCFHKRWLPPILEDILAKDEISDKAAIGDRDEVYLQHSSQRSDQFQCRWIRLLPEMCEGGFWFGFCVDLQAPGYWFFHLGAEISEGEGDSGKLLGFRDRSIFFEEEHKYTCEYLCAKKRRRVRTSIKTGWRAEWWPVFEYRGEFVGGHWDAERITEIFLAGIIGVGGCILIASLRIRYNHVHSLRSCRDMISLMISLVPSRIWCTLRSLTYF